MTLTHAPIEGAPTPAASPRPDPGRPTPGRPGQGRMTMRAIGVLGEACITIGFLLLTFAGFQLWGTGLAESRAQDDLDTQFEQVRAEALARAEVVDLASTPDGEAETPAPIAMSLDQLPRLGEAVGRISIPAIGVEKTFVEGVARDDLRNGPGHYPTTSYPGQPGNSAIAGHRTTNGAPFIDIDLLVPGDEILVETVQGSFTYEVMAHAGPDDTEVGHFIVSSDGSHVLEDQGDDRLTLTACHPKYSAEQRIVVTAVLVSEAAPTVIRETGDEVQATSQATVGTPAPTLDPPTANTIGTGVDQADSTEALEESLGWNFDHLNSVLLWAGITLLVGLAIRLASGRLDRLARFALWWLSAPIVITCLFVWFTHLDRLIPAV